MREDRSCTCRKGRETEGEAGVTRTRISEKPPAELGQKRWGSSHLDSDNTYRALGRAETELGSDRGVEAGRRGNAAVYSMTLQRGPASLESGTICGCLGGRAVGSQH